MKPKTPLDTPNRDLFRIQLSDIINPKHELVLLEQTIVWAFFRKEWARFFSFQDGLPVVEVQGIPCT
jgi:hypothetical protein